MCVCERERNPVSLAFELQGHVAMQIKWNSVCMVLALDTTNAGTTKGRNSLPLYCFADISN